MEGQEEEQQQQQFDECHAWFFYSCYKNEQNNNGKILPLFSIPRQPSP